jgi:hypothetical protein
VCRAGQQGNACNRDIARDGARAVFKIVAISRSSRATDPISRLSETGTSPSSRLTISAASSRSCRGETGAKTLVIASPSA